MTATVTDYTQSQQETFRLLVTTLMCCGSGKRLGSIAAVSYTHLDVYKRQEYKLISIRILLLTTPIVLQSIDEGGRETPPGG